jgi:PIN domain nuclease of toxin-antitoxin system
MTPKRAYLLDASALLAVLFGEPGGEVVIGIIDACAIHAVNLAEAVRKMLHTGVPVEETEAILGSLDLDVSPILSANEALAAGRLAFSVRDFGLSLGDCVCLSVAAQAGQKVVTADRSWSEIDGLGVEVLQIR